MLVLYVVVFFSYWQSRNSEVGLTHPPCSTTRVHHRDVALVLYSIACSLVVMSLQIIVLSYDDNEDACRTEAVCCKVRLLANPGKSRSNFVMSGVTSLLTHTTNGGLVKPMH